MLCTIFLSSLLFPNNNLEAASTEQKIEELKKQMEEMQKQHLQQIDELRKQIEELAEQKAKDSEKAEVLVKTDPEEDTWWKNIRVDYLKQIGGISVETVDGNFKLRTRLRAQFLTEYLDHGEGDDSLGFRVRRARIIFDGHAFRPWFRYLMQFDFSGDPELKDMVFDIAYNEQFIPRVGQYKVPFNREELTGAGSLQFVDRSELNREFNFSRDVGAGVWGKINRIVYYEFGVFQGDGTNTISDRHDSSVLWAGRIQYSPLGNDIGISSNFTKKPTLSLGLSIAGINTSSDAEGNFRDTNLGGAADRLIELGATGVQVISFSGDINFKHPLFSLEGEYIGRWTDPDNTVVSSIYDHGFRVQSGVFLIPNTLEVASRFIFIMFDDSAEGKDVIWEITPAISYYMSKDHRWKLVFDYSFIREEFVDGDKEDLNRLRAQLQLYF